MSSTLYAKMARVMAATSYIEKDGKNPLPGVAESIGYLRGVCDATK